MDDRNDEGTQFSELSYGPLINILSFLPFKESVRASVLSREWESLWLCSTNVELFEEYFVTEEDATPEAVVAHRLEFMDFVRRWMRDFSSSSIDNFSFRFSEPYNFAEDVNQCIALALRKGVKRLEIDFSDPPLWDLFADHLDLCIDFDLLPAVYDHKGLTSLILSWCVVDFAKFGNNLIGLKEITLEYLEIDNTTLPILLQGCPLLESLTLTRCWNWIYALEMEGEAPNLNTLVIDECNCKFGNNWFRVRAPNLRVFKFIGVVGVFEFDLGNRIEEAELDFGLHASFHEECGTLLFQLLLSLSSARALTVCSFMLQVIPTIERTLWTGTHFSVKHLTLNTSLQPRDLRGVSFFLFCCPILQTLTVEINPPNVLKGYEPRGAHRFQAANVIHYRCIVRTLKEVEIKGFRGTRGEMSLLKYLIRYGRVLMEVKVYVSPTVTATRCRRLVEDLRAAPRVSPRLQILPFY